jgi:hypothetical protein
MPQIGMASECLMAYDSAANAGNANDNDCAYAARQDVARGARGTRLRVAGRLALQHLDMIRQGGRS